jgi:hypothetical protein
MEGLPKVEAALKEGDLPRAAREQGALAEQARAAAAALRAGSSVQNAQDMADRAFSAEREGRELGDSIERLKGNLSPAEAAELQKALASVDDALEELRKSIEALPEAAEETRAVRELPLEGAREAASALRRALQSGDAAGAAKAAKELAEKLSRVAKGLRESGKRAAQSQAGRNREAAGRVAQAWREAVARQEKAVEAARRRETARLAETVRAQRQLLLQSQDAIDTALASAPSVGARTRRGNLKGGRADEAVRLMRAAAGQSRQASLSDRARAAAHEATAKTLDDAASALERGASVPALDPAATREAADIQATARESAGRLRRVVSDAAGVLGLMPGGPVRRIDDAMSEQDAGEKSLRAGDAAEGLRRGEAALAILQDDKGASEDEPGGGSGGAATLSRPFEIQAAPCAPRRAAPAGARRAACACPPPTSTAPPRAARGSSAPARAAAHDSAIKSTSAPDPLTEGVRYKFVEFSRGRAWRSALAIITACHFREPSRRTTLPARTVSTRRSGASCTAERIRFCAIRPRPWSAISSSARPAGPPSCPRRRGSTTSRTTKSSPSSSRFPSRPKRPSGARRCRRISPRCAGRSGTICRSATSPRCSSGPRAWPSSSSSRIGAATSAM